MGDKQGQNRRVQMGKPGMHEGKSPQKVHEEAPSAAQKQQENRNVDLDKRPDDNKPKRDRPRD